MSTKNQQTNQYDPNSFGAFGALTGAGSQGLLSMINNPYGNMFFNNQLGMGQQQIAGNTSTANNALMQSTQAMGMNPSSQANRFMQLMNFNQGRAQNSGLFNNLLLNASNMRAQAIGGALNYRPLQTGTTQQTSGTGTWLPQVAGAAAQIGMGIATGGASMAAGGLLGQQSQGAVSSMMAPGGLANNFNPMAAYGPGTGYGPGSFGNMFLPGSGYGGGQY